MLSKLNKILLLVNLFFLQSYLIEFNIGEGNWNLQLALITLQLVVYLLSKFSKKTEAPSLKYIKNYWILSGFLILTTITALVVEHSQTLEYAAHLKTIFSAIILVFIFLESFQEGAERTKALKIAGYGAVAFGVFSVLYNLIGYNTPENFIIRGPFQDSTPLALYLTPFLIFFLVRFWEDRYQTTNVILGLVLLIVTASTQVWEALIIAFIVFLIYSVKKGKIPEGKSRKLIFVILTLTFGAIILQTNFSENTLRDQAWQSSRTMLDEPDNAIYGLGLGQFEYQSLQVAEIIPNPKHPHNIFFLFLFNYGALGLLFVFYLSYRLLSKILRRHENAHSSGSRFIAELMLLYLWLHSLTAGQFFRSDLFILLLLLMEMGLGHITAAQKPNPTKKRKDRRLS